MATETYCEHCGDGPTCLVCGRGIDNPTPQEAAGVPRLMLETILFRRNFGERNTRDSYWRRIHRYQARRAAGELRYLTNRPRKNINAGL